MPRIKVYRDKRGQWRFRVVAANGEIVAQSEAYTRKHGAVRGARRLKAVIAAAEVQ